MSKELCYRNNPKNLFRKYAHLITWFANQGIGRDYLGVPKKIALMLPNGFVEDGNGVYRTTFYTRPVYAPKLYPALAKLDLVREWLKDFKEAQQILAWELGLTRNMPALAKAVMFASPLTVYPSGTSGVSPIDGYVGRASANETLAVIRAGAGTTKTDTPSNAGTPQLIASATTNQFAALYRGIYCFDTSSLGTGANISNVVFSLFGKSSSSNALGSPVSHIVAATPASTSTLANADYSNLGSTSFGSIAYASWSDIAYNDFALNTSGIANINKTGVSKYGDRTDWDLNNSFTGSWGSGKSSFFLHWFSGQTGTDNDPKLVVTYGIGGAFLFHFI